jgi:hypothetical protein
MTWDPTRTITVESRRLTVSAVALPTSSEVSLIYTTFRKLDPLPSSGVRTQITRTDLFLSWAALRRWACLDRWFQKWAVPPPGGGRRALEMGHSQRVVRFLTIEVT